LYTIFDSKLVEPMVPSAWRQIMAFCSLFLPNVLTIALTPLANTYGAYQVINMGTWAKVLLSFGMIVGGIQAWGWWSALYLINVVLSKAIWGFYNLVFSDVIDEDSVINNRRENLSASMHGIHALFVKPAQSLGPMVGVWIISKYPYKEPLSNLTSETTAELQGAVFSLISWVPILCAVLQLFVWRYYTLHGTHLASVKTRLEKRMDSDGQEEEMKFI